MTQSVSKNTIIISLKSFFFETQFHEFIFTTLFNILHRFNNKNMKQQNISQSIYFHYFLKCRKPYKKILTK